MGVFDDLLSESNLNAVGTGLAAAGQFIGAESHFAYGSEQRAAATFAAQQMRDQANEDQAAAQRTAWSTDLQTRYLASRALAVAGASGAGASDPTVVNVISRMAGEGAYRGAVALYGGEDRARYLNLQADATERSGALAQSQSDAIGEAQIVGGMASVVRGAARGYANDFRNNAPNLLQDTSRGASLFSRFGGDGPQRVDATPNYVY